MEKLRNIQFENQFREVRKMERNDGHPLDPIEVRCLKACHYYVMGGRQYKVTDTQTLPSGTAHVYVEFIGDDTNPYPEKYVNPMIKHVEVRDIETMDLLFAFPLQHDIEVLDIILSSTIYIPEQGKKEINRYKQIAIDSIEFDQDRACYVYYGTQTGVVVNEKGFRI